jgi:hypothetical protein
LPLPGIPRPIVSRGRQRNDKPYAIFTREHIGRDGRDLASALPALAILRRNVTTSHISFRPAMLGRSEQLAPPALGT